MRISTNTYFSKLKNGKETTFKERLIDVKNAGFDAVGLQLHKEKISIQEQSKLCDELGLEITYIHSDYGLEHLLNNFWLDNEIGDGVEKMFADQILECKGANCKNIVYHLCCSYEAEIGQIGLDRIQRLCKLSKENGFNFCIENTFRPDKFDYIFSNLDLDNLKICFDAGHEFCLTPISEIVEKHYDKVSCMHLHDNCGTYHKTKNSKGETVPSSLNDEHKILGKGKINVEALAKKLALVSEDVPLNMEFKCIIRKLDEFKNCANIDIGYTTDDLKEVYNTLVELENKIKQYK